MKNLEHLIDDLNKKSRANIALNPQKHGFDKYSKSPHLFSNQWAFTQVLADLSALPCLKIPGKQNIAIILGESYFLSSLPELAKHVDTIIFVDMDEKVLINNMNMLACFKRASTPANFSDLYLTDENPIVRMQIEVNSFTTGNLSQITKVNNPTPVRIGVNELTALMETGLEQIKKYHFLSSVKRFDHCKQAAQKMTFYCLKADILNEQFMQEIGNLFVENGISIRVFNITNLFDYEGNFPSRERQSHNENWRPGTKLLDCLNAIIDRPERIAILYAVTAIEYQFDRLVAGMAHSLPEYEILNIFYTEMRNTFYASRGPAGLTWQDYARQIKGKLLINHSLRTPYNFFEPTATFERTWLEGFKFLVQCIDDTASIEYRNHKTPHRSIDALIRSSSSNKNILLPLFKKHHVAYQYFDASDTIIICDINTARQEMNIISFMKNEMLSIIKLHSVKFKSMDSKIQQQEKTEICKQKENKIAQRR